MEVPTFKLPSARPGTHVSDALVVRNQRAEGSCTGQALAAVVDIQNIRRFMQGASVPRRVSARMLYAAAQAFDEFPDDDLPGSSVRGVIKGFWNRGACSDGTMPYVPGWRNDTLTVAIAREARDVSLGTYMRLRPILNDYHCALMEADAILVSAMIHDGWVPERVRNSGGFINVRDVPRLKGAHAFAIVGFTPKGFLVLNSWGGAWGNFDVHAAVSRRLATLSGPEGDTARKNLEAAGIGPGGLSGIGLWRYEDWQRHVLDAWVLRLAAPTRLPSGISGGYRVANLSAGAAQPASAHRSRSVRESDVLGHLVHFSGAELVKRGVHASPLATIQETARFLEHEERSAKYDNVVVYAHGAFDTRDRVLSRASAMIPIFKRNRIYPIFLLYRSNFNEIVGDLLRPLMPEITEKTGGNFAEVNDVLLERMSAPIGTILWSNFKRDAALAFEQNTEVRRALFQLVQSATCGSNVKPRGLHFISSSGGALVLGELMVSLSDAKIRRSTRTISLIAPACTLDFLGEKLASPRTIDTTLYTLASADEKRPDPALGVYGKSTLWLVSRAFEQTPGTELAGIRDHLIDKKIKAHVVTASPRSSECRATRHGGFDNDPYTMNHILRRITGQRHLNDGNGGFSLTEIGDGDTF